MKNNKDIVYLIENGLHVKTLSKMSVPQIRVLAEKFKTMRQETKEAETVQNSVTKYSKSEVDAAKTKGQSLPAGKAVKLNPDGSMDVTNEGEMTEFTESVEVNSDPNKETETQDPIQVGPGTNDGDNNNNDGMPTNEGELREKFESKAQQNFFWGKCHTTKGVQKQKWCQLAREFSNDTTIKDYKKMPKKLHPEKTVKVKKSEKTETIEKFLEKKISEMVESKIQAKMSKKDLIAAVKKKKEPKTEKSMIIRKPKKMNMFSDEAPMELPIGRMFSIGKTK